MSCLVACLATPPGSLLLPDAEREQPQLSSLLKTWQRAQPAESTPASRRNHLREEKSCKELVHKVIEASVWQGPGALNVLSGRAGSARIKARVARCVDQFAEAAAASMQLQLRGLVAPGEACLVTALSGHPDKRRPDAGRYHLGHQVFMSSLLRQHPDFDLPVIVFSHDTNATDATTPTQLQTQARAAYSRTIFVEPSTPVFTIARKYYRFGNGRLATSKSPLWKQGFYYARLQLFLLTMCSSVVAVDTSESLVRRPFLDAVLAAVRSSSGGGGGGGGGGAGSAAPADQPNNDNAPLPLAPFAECQQSGAFAAPPLCGTSTEGPRPYFNAGIFAVGGACLNRPTFARLITTALLPPRPVGWNRRKRLNWADDQDVLNSVFSEPRWRKLPENLTADKRVLRHPRCAAMGAPAVLHFVGTKPWAPLYERAVPSERDPKVVAVELAWWHEYLRDKTVVVGAGPSLRRPIGAWIEMFGTIVRVNDLATDDAWLTGVRTTHAFVHTATRATPALRSTLRGLRRSAIHVAAFGDNASVVQARFRRPGGLGLDLASQCTLLDPWYHRGLNRQLGMADPERRHAMLGTVALEWSLRRLVGPAADDEDRRLGDLNGPEDELAADDELADDDEATAGPVFIVGFDMTLHPERQYRHYGGHPAGAGQTSRASLKKFHEPRADSRYVRSLVARGLVRELVPDVLGAGKVNLRWSNNMTRRRVVHHFVMNMSKAMLSAHGHI